MRPCSDPIREAHRQQRRDELTVALATLGAARTAWEEVAFRHRDALVGLHRLTSYRAQSERMKREAALFVAERRERRLTAALERLEREADALLWHACDCDVCRDDVLLPDGDEAAA